MPGTASFWRRGRFASNSLSLRRLAPPSRLWLGIRGIGMAGENPQTTTPKVSEAIQRYAWHRQRLLRAAIATLLAAPVAVAAGWAFAKYAKPPALAGAVVTPPIQAADFRLKDQHGAAVSMSALHGKVVALTFLYTHCPDACPLIADMMHKDARRHRQARGVRSRSASILGVIPPRRSEPSWPPIMWAMSWRT